MVGMGIDGVNMRVPAVVVVVMVVMSMAVIMVIVIVGQGGLQADADPLDMMVMALLRRADLGLEAQNLGAVLAHLAIHGGVARQDLPDALLECVDDQRMIVEIGRLDELDARISARHSVASVIDSLNQNAGEEKIGE